MNKKFLNHFIFDGVRSDKFGILLTGNVWGYPERDITTFHVPGLNGELTMDNGRWNNVSITFECGIPRNYMLYMPELRAFLLSSKGQYKRLETSYYEDVYMLARYRGGMEPAQFLRNESGKFTLDFDCKPQKFLKSGEVPIVSPTTIFNPTLYDAKPLIKVTGQGSFTINSTTVQINRSGTTYLDCEIMNAYYNGTNYNSSMVGDFPVLKPGKNNITTNGVTLEITPRWFTI